MATQQSILITGAAGRTSSWVIDALLKHDPSTATRLRLLVRSDSSRQKAQTKWPQIPPSAFVLGDYLDFSTLPPAFKGVDIVFYNGPAFHQLESAMGIAVIDAAKAAGVQHFVFCSVLFPILDNLLNHKAKRPVEEYLIESGLNYTILEPTSFMQNIPLEPVFATKTLSAVYTPTVLQGFLDLTDLAEIARLVIEGPAPHNRARYELVGENRTLQEVAHVLSAFKGTAIGCTQAPRSEMRKLIDVQGAYATEALDRMLYYYDRRGIPGNNNTVRWLLNREPTTWAALLRRDY